MATKRKYYAENSPRGFDNEWNFYAFPDKKTREHFVREGNGDITTSHFALTFSYMTYLNRYYFIVLIFWSRSHNSANLFRGGSWVDEYRKTDGTMVKGYCRDIKWEYAMDQEYWQQNEWEKRRR